MWEQNASGRWLLYATWLTAALSSLVVLAIPFPPMQDLPQHLFQVKAWTTFADPAYNWGEFYRLDFKPGPYNLPYAIIAVLSFAMPIMWAAKFFLVLCILLYAWLIQLTGSTDPELKSPWPLLLAFPLFFQHIYYYGNLATLIGVPLSLLAATDLKCLATRGKTALGCWGWLLLAALFFTHPFCVAAYVTLGVGMWVKELWHGKKCWKLLVQPVALLGVYALWHFLVFAPSTGGLSGPGGFRWEPRLFYGAYQTAILLPFTGMRFNNGVDWPSTFCWIAAALFSVASLWSAGTGARRDFYLRLAAALFWFALFFALPYHVGRYAVFNLKALPYAYWFLLIALTMLPSQRWVSRQLPFVLAVALLAPIYFKNAAASRNIQDAVSLMKNLKPNRTILWQNFDGKVEEVDSHNFFYYSHVVFYYQVLVGGGFNPNLAYNTMWPVTYSDKVPEHAKEPKLSALSDGTETVGYGWSFTEPGSLEPWERYYDYLLVQDAPAKVLHYLSSSGTLTTTAAGRFTLISRERTQPTKTGG